MLTFTLLNPRRPRTRQAKPPQIAPSPPPPPPPPPAEVTVVLATVFSNQAVDFEFSLPVTCDGGECPAIVLDMGGGIIDYPRTSAQVSANVVRFFWVDDFVDAGDAWSIGEAPAQGLDLHGATMPVPQAGVVG